ncbi:MAG TPA: LuxR family transcriptional regulator, partial [Geodermatophilus sp.]|nr:LuxR family transcriptional regulator [Geodermatophilus sp.]
MSAATGWAPELVRELTASCGRVPAVVTVVGPGGTGKSLLLAELATAHERAGLAVLDAVPEDPAALPGPVAVLVDDAHHLPDADVARLGVLLRSPAARVVLAQRPWPRPAALGALLAEVGPARRTVVLGHADRARLREWSRELLGEALAPPLADAVLTQTGGLPAFAVPLLRRLGRRGGVPGQPGRLVVPDEVTDRVRADLAAVAEETRALLHALAAGAPLDEDVLGELLGVSSDRAVDLLDAGRATGLLLGTGEVVPLAARALLTVTPPDVTRRVRRQLLALLVERGDEPVELARRLAAERVRDRHAARLLERHGEAALTDDPALAAQLLGEAARSGAPVASLAGRRAQAAALAGDLDGALQWADTVLADETAPDRARAAGVTAAVLAQRGLLSRAAGLCRLAGAERAGSAALALLATGEPGAAA